MRLQNDTARKEPINEYLRKKNVLASREVEF